MTKIRIDGVFSPMKFKEARQKMGYSLDDLAKYLGYKGHKTILDIDLGKRQIQLSELLDLAYLFGREYPIYVKKEPSIKNCVFDEGIHYKQWS